MSTESVIYEIPEWNVNRLHKEIDKLNRRADKLDVPHIQLIPHGIVEVADPAYTKELDIGIMTWNSVPKIQVHKFEIVGPAPKLAGWTFVGKLDHNTLPGQVIVDAVPGHSVPEQFFHSEPICEHCGKIRRRNDTFVLAHENGEYKQVGRQCIRDFLGHDPTAIANFLSRMWKLINELDDRDDEWWGGGGSAYWTFPHEQVLSLTVAHIRMFGWIARSAADPMVGRTATADEILSLLIPSKDSTVRERQRKLIEKLEWSKEKDGQEAHDAMEWLKTQPANNEYMVNLHTIAAADSVPTKLFGYWCSLAAAYQRAQERLRLNQAQKKVNEWVGNVKDKIEIVVTITGISHVDSYYGYGTVHIHRMLDDEGHTLVWFANTNSGMEVGHKYKIRATVKKHDVYNNWKQTVLILNRVGMKEEIGNE